MTVFKWSKTAGSNDVADQGAPGNIDWREGQSPATVNDSARGMMAAIAKWRDDIGGTQVTTGGPTAYLLTTSQGLPGSLAAPPQGTAVTFYMNVTNAVNATLRVDGGVVGQLQTGAGTNVAAGVLLQNSLYTATFNTAGNLWVLNNVYNVTPPGSVPIGAVTPYAGATDPAGGFFLICDGRALSRTVTYGSLFAILGTSYGVGDGSTTFNIPDLRGRVAAGLDGTGTRLTSATMTPDGNTRGATGGLQSRAQLAAEVGAHSHTATSTDSGHVHNINITTVLVTSGGVGIGVPSAAGTPTASEIVSGNASITTTVSATAAAVAMPLMQPTLLLNYIIRVL